VVKPASTKSWISQLLGRDVRLAPRQSPDEIPAARQLWDLRHLNQDLPELAAFHERVLLRTRRGTDLTAEIYVPRGTGPFPTMLYMHGGSWCLWSPAHVRKMVMRFAASGYVVINLDYGLAPEHRFPWAVEDVVHAARWATKHAPSYGGRANAFVMAGDSAGANLAAAGIVALKGYADTPLEKDALADIPVSVGAALFVYGVFDFPLLFAEPGKNAGAGTIETTWNLAYLGPNFVGVHRNPLVSPAYWSGIAEFPPTYLTCGARDALLPQTLRMTRVLAGADVSTTVSIVGDADHGFLMLADTDDAAMKESQRICDWLAQVGKAPLWRRGSESGAMSQQVAKCGLP
jgi:acetyl esterase